MTFNRLIMIFFPVCLTLICTLILVKFQLPDAQRTKLCSSARPLIEIDVNDYDFNGVKLREGTFTRKVYLESKRELKVIIFPKALSFQIWSKVPQASIQYIGKGGDDSWLEWLRPDYFYLLKVPSQATGLAFGRLCYRNGDVEVDSIKKLQQISPSKIIINDKVYLSHSSPLPMNNSYSIIVNAGSDRRDILGTQTEVYFTIKSFKIDELDNLLD